MQNLLRTLVHPLALCGAALAGAPMQGHAQSEVVSWGQRVFNSAWSHEAFVGVAAGASHTLALRSDGSVVAWGWNGYDLCTVPALPSGLTYVEVAAGLDHTLARRSDGRVLAWGRNDDSQCNVPALPSGLAYVVEVAASWYHTVARYQPDLVTSFCVPAQAGVIACPCSNPPAGADRGCDNSAATGGAQLSSSGFPSLAADTLQFQTSGELPAVLSVVLQGDASDATGLVFGEGVRCVTGTRTRLRIEDSVGGGIVYPDGTETAVAAMSALLGDPIGAGSTRWYQVYYRDPALPCAFEPNFNATQGLAIQWNP